LLSWRVAILPYIEQDNLYKQFHLDEPWDSDHNKRLAETVVKVYSPVLGKGAPNTTYYRVFVGEGAIFEEKKETRFQDVTDGTSNTILVVEAGEAVPWTKPDELPFGAGKPIPKLGGQFKDTFPLALADGSVHFVDLGVGDKLRPFITKSGGEVVTFDDLKPKK